MEDDDRPLPFVLRVAVEWRDLDEVAEAARDGVLLYRNRALLTGNLASTANGADVTFSDLGISRDPDHLEPAD